MTATQQIVTKDNIQNEISLSCGRFPTVWVSYSLSLEWDGVHELLWRHCPQKAYDHPVIKVTLQAKHNTYHIQTTVRRSPKQLHLTHTTLPRFSSCKPNNSDVDCISFFQEMQSKLGERMCNGAFNIQQANLFLSVISPSLCVCLCFTHPTATYPPLPLSNWWWQLFFLKQSGSECRRSGC